MRTSDAPDTLPVTPVATAPQPPGLLKIEWRDIPVRYRNGRWRYVEMPYRNGQPLEGQALYLGLGRPDLAEAYRKRQATKTGLGVAAGTFLGSFAITDFIAIDQSGGGHGAPVPMRIAVVSSLVLGLAFGIADICTPADVVTPAELHRLVDAHNQTP